MASVKVLKGDCLTVLDDFPEQSFDLIYLDPPFFTQKHHQLTTRDGATTFRFQDIWDSHQEYGSFLYERIVKLHQRLSETGSLFFHCDKNASHIIRLILDQIFGSENFQSEIIWTYRRWSNSSKSLLPAHQTIFFYSKSSRLKFHQTYTDYSETTNLDQISQKRARDERNKSIYARDGNGNPVLQGAKKGVPLSDVWDIPFLNPKAKERAGYPTQKPVFLLERIISLCTDKGDWVLDPFCGSGTSLVASQFLERNAIGIDISESAIELTQNRLNNPIRTTSLLLKHGRANYARTDFQVLDHLKGIEYFVVQRNNGIDAILKDEVEGKPVFIRIQREGEDLSEAISALNKAVSHKGPAYLILVVINQTELTLDIESIQSSNYIHLVNSPAIAIKAYIEQMGNQPDDCFGRELLNNSLYPPPTVVI
ncbi:MAG: DNA-methyltransferase [Janthinobacterium lividum]